MSAERLSMLGTVMVASGMNMDSMWVKNRNFLVVMELIAPKALFL